MLRSSEDMSLISTWLKKMKDFQSTTSKEIPEAQTAALQSSFRFPVVDYPFDKYTLTHCHLSYQNISRQSCITTRVMLLQQSAPFGQLFYNLYCFTIFIHNQLLTINPLTDDVSAIAAMAAATLLCCAAFLRARASPCQAGRNLCCGWLSRSVMNYCSDVSVGTAELSHRVPAQSPPPVPAQSMGTAVRTCTVSSC